MTAYHKINSIFKRDEKTKKLIVGVWSTPEFQYLQDSGWHFTEKVDGTNIRIVVHDDGSFVVGGRTDNAQIPAALAARINERFIPQRDRLREVLPQGGVIYAEGYGAGIQAAGKGYRPDQDIIVFDVRVGDWWLRRDDVIDVSSRLGLDVVPYLDAGTLHCAVRKASLGIASKLADIAAEGIVARPIVELRDRAGARIIAKIKCRDFACDEEEAA